jgi:hypothetical protein
VTNLGHPESIQAREAVQGRGQRRALHGRFDGMNRHGLAKLNRREFPGVQLEIIRLYRANGTFKGGFNPDAWIRNITYQRVRAQDNDISAFWALADFGYFRFERGHLRSLSNQHWEGEAPLSMKKFDSVIQPNRATTLLSKKRFRASRYPLTKGKGNEEVSLDNEPGQKVTVRGRATEPLSTYAILASYNDTVGRFPGIRCRSSVEIYFDESRWNARGL